MSASKVARLIAKFDRIAARHGRTFHEFLSAEANLTGPQRRRVFGNPDLARCIAYLDRTGEAAVNHVMRDRGY